MTRTNHRRDAGATGAGATRATRADLVTADDWLTLSEAAELLPTRPVLSTILRWATRGLRGGTVRLETRRFGGRRVTRRAWLSAFVAAMSAPVAGRKRKGSR